MANKNDNSDLLDVLRAGGLRKRVAKTVDDAVSGTRKRAKPPKAVRSVITDLRELADEIEDRATGKRAKRQAAARKGAATRRLKARKRSEAAKRAARTRAKA
jgi:hypothetical protein